MKPFVLAMLAIILSGCAGGNPTVPSQTPSQPPVPSPGLTIVLAVVTTATDTKVVFRGNASLNVAVPQLLGPEFVMTCV